MPIDELIDGLKLIRAKNADAPVVTQAYIITVPAVPQTAFTGMEQDMMVAWGWLVHPIYQSYYYPAQTLTELANVTGENAGEIPVIEPVVPPLPMP